MTIRVPSWILGFIWGQEVRYITKQSYAGCDPAYHWSIFMWAWVSPAGWASKLLGCEICSGETGFYLSGTRASAFPSPQHKIPDRGFSVRLQKGRVQVPLRMSPFYCLGSLSHQGARGGLALSFVTLEAEWGQSWSLCPGLSRLCNVLKRKASVFSLIFVFIVLLINFPGSHWTPESFCLGLRSSWTWKCALPVSLLRETSFITLPYLY